eukprot:scaffold1353_cov417-Prasinococcus_capsulatus_cf.AAC.6
MQELRQLVAPLRALVEAHDVTAPDRWVYAGIQAKRPVNRALRLLVQLLSIQPRLVGSMRIPSLPVARPDLLPLLYALALPRSMYLYRSAAQARTHCGHAAGRANAPLSAQPARRARALGVLPLAIALLLQWHWCHDTPLAVVAAVLRQRAATQRRSCNGARALRTGGMGRRVYLVEQPPSRDPRRLSWPWSRSGDDSASKLSGDASVARKR